MPRPEKPKAPTTTKAAAEVKITRAIFAAIAGPMNDTQGPEMVALRDAIESTDDETLKAILADGDNKPSLEEVIAFAKKLYELGKIGYGIAKKLGVIK